MRRAGRDTIGAMRCFLLALLLVFSAGAQQSSNTAHQAPDSQAPAASAWGSEDLDRDGIPDALEQMLLERFLPRFHVSGEDCDVMPSRFSPGQPDPVSVERDGTIYGQAFPAPRGPAGAGIELHYYHLWSKDCGRFSHALDVEQVAALVETNLPEHPADLAAAIGQAREPWHWAAVYWFAAGHQSTVCDVSHAAKATVLVAEHTGPDVWISSGKHASYLSHERCRLGCGGDTCPDMAPLAVKQVINVGERNAPLNGAVWTASKRWPFHAKMVSQFGALTVQRIDSSKPGTIVSVNEALPPVRATILAGGETLDGVATGGKHTGDALKTGKDSTGNALGTAAESTGNALLRSFRAVKRAMGAKPDAGNGTVVADTAATERATAGTVAEDPAGPE